MQLGQAVKRGPRSVKGQSQLLHTQPRTGFKIKSLPFSSCTVIYWQLPFNYLALVGGASWPLCACMHSRWAGLGSPV